MSRPLFSVITVCRNAESTLGRCRASLECQSLGDFEWIVVDGASQDGSLEVIRGFSRSELKLVSESDEGIFNAMNKGVGMASGRYIYFLNADDELADGELLADVARAAERHGWPDVIVGDVVYVGAGGNRLRRFRQVTWGNLIVGDLCHQAVFASSDLFRKVGRFAEQFRLNADYDWLLRALKEKASFVFAKRVVAHFYLGGEHTRDFAKLVAERRQVRLQYVGTGELAVRESVAWLRHKLGRALRSAV